MNAVIFSVSIFNPAKAWMAEVWLRTLADKFADCDVYIGINPATCQEVVKLVESASLNKVVRVVPEHLYCESDASGTQAALLAAKESGKRYDYFWFAHTKGGVNDREDRFAYYITQFLENRKEIENIMVKNPHVGVYGHYGVGQSADGVTQWPTLSHIEFDHADFPIVNNGVRNDVLKCSHVNFSYVETFYVIKGVAVHYLLDNAKPEYFTTRIKNRWYGEVVLPWLPTRMGLYPYIKHPVSGFSPYDLNNVVNTWARDNNLSFPTIVT